MKDKSKIYQIIISLLVLIILILGITSYVNSNQEKYFNEGVLYGQQNIAEVVRYEISNRGIITFENGNETLTLVSTDSLEIVSQELLLEIKNSIEEKGYVVISDSTGEDLILVKYEGEISVN